MKKVLATYFRPIDIGIQTDNETTVVMFDTADWVDEYGDFTFGLVHKRNGDEDFYPCNVSYDGDKVYWVIGIADVAKPGKGECILSAFRGTDEVAKSKPYETICYATPDNEADPPEAYQSWVNAVLAAGESAKNYAQEASSHADQAEEYSESAKDEADKAKEYADLAEDSADRAAISEENAAKDAEALKYAAGGMSFVSFELNTDGDLMMNNTERLGSTNFYINDNGDLEVDI